MAQSVRDEIRFYSTKDNYGCFSSFPNHPFELEGKIWPTSEHYFQAAKFPDNSEYVEEIRCAKSAMIAAKLGRSRTHKLRPDWESEKEQIMLHAVRAKFSQNANIQQILLATKNAILVEHTTNDNYWGDGGDGTGKNMLGLILMFVRDDLTKPERAPTDQAKIDAWRIAQLKSGDFMASAVLSL